MCATAQVPPRPSAHNENAPPSTAIALLRCVWLGCLNFRWVASFSRCRLNYYRCGGGRKWLMRQFLLLSNRICRLTCRMFLRSFKTTLIPSTSQFQRSSSPFPRALTRTISLAAKITPLAQHHKALTPRAHQNSSDQPVVVHFPLAKVTRQIHRAYTTLTTRRVPRCRGFEVVTRIPFTLAAYKM